MLRYRRALSDKRRYLKLRRDTDEILTKIRYLNQIAMSVRERPARRGWRESGDRSHRAPAARVHPASARRRRLGRLSRMPAAAKRRRARSATPLPERAREIYGRLVEHYPDAHCALDFKSPFQLLVATILSAQCTDKRVNMVTPALFKRYRTPAALAVAKPEELEEMIKSTGFFRNKTKSLLGMSNAVADGHDGQGSRHDGRAGEAAGRRTKDGERRPRECVRQERRRRRRHARRPSQQASRSHDARPTR